MNGPQLLSRRRIDESTFVIASNGYAEGPAQALRDFLVANGARRVTTVDHPLVAEGRGEHVVTAFAGGRTSTKRYRLPNLPPYTYLLDPFVPLRLPVSTAWFGFNNLAALRGLVRRRRGATGAVYYWAVDYVPRRFGDGAATRAYERLDRLVCTNVDARIELADAARDARSHALRLDPEKHAPAVVVPMGAWLGRAPQATAASWPEQRLVFLGHLVERQGVDSLLRSLPRLVAEHPRVRLDVVGGGPLEDGLRRLARTLGVADRVELHGFVKDHRAVEAILGRSTIALAPYREDRESFTRFADPGKVKAYLAAGLPIVLTDVPPNARALEAAGAAIVSPGEPEALAAAVGRLLEDEGLWLAAHTSALESAKRFDWNALLREGLAQLGFDTGDTGT